MNKEESLTFLQSCMEKVKNASAKDIQFYKELYRLNCALTPEVSDFEIIFPANDAGYSFEINDSFKLDVSNQQIKSTAKKQMEYSFLGSISFNQQNNDSLSYAA